MVNLGMTLASFTRPENISITPFTLLWIIPLLIAISAVYKATKLRVLLWRVFFRETLILILSTCVFMLFVGIATWIIIALAA